MKTPLSLLALIALLPPVARADFHFWDIQEAYTTLDGSVQFVELFTTSAGQNNLSPAHTLASTGAPTFTFPNDLPNVTTANKTFLVGTSNLMALYGITPDYIIPAGFLDSGAGNVLNFAEGTDTVNLTALPTDGVMSLNGVVGNASASTTSVNAQATPRNFAGQTVTIPEPATAAGLATGLLLMLLRRRPRAGQSAAA